MSTVVVDDNGRYYGGFVEGAPHWQRTRRAECVLDDEVARMVERQLRALGFECKRLDLGGHVRND